MSATPTTDPATRGDRPRSTIGALAVLTAALALLAGPIGAVAGLATALTWYGLGTPYALAAGHVVLAAAFTEGIGLETFLLVELAFVAVLLAAVVRTPTVLRDAVVVLASAIAFVGAGWIVADSRSIWIAAGTLPLLVALAAYALHRYELVSLGLVPDAVDTPPDANVDADADSPTHEQ
ncbi:hypothetical protein [Haloterrigena salifodinae]|uniref:hypothetical protein n=1 Tax=Haloterrigena salifodinae TaxID=2675099 RepID=UPI000F867746|nr:hypothetical protein [Haloterrigena salifodinae]